MSELNLYRINNFYSPKTQSPEHPQMFRACIFTKRVCTKIRPGHLAVNEALKTIYVFYCGKIPAKQVLCSRRSKVSASRPYAPDTRGVCFQGPSRALWYLKPLRKRRGMKSGFSTVLSGTGQNVQPVLARQRQIPQFRTAALRSNRRCGAAALHTGKSRGRWFIWCLCRCLKTAYLYSSTRRVRCS